MPSSQQKQKAKDPIYELGNLALMSNFIEKKSEYKELNKALQIANVLQTTLDISKLIEVYSHEIKTLVTHDSINFENKVQEIDIALGAPEKHSCSYQLVVAAQSLGQLSITRKSKFTAKETMLMEYLLCGLVYPLRNAISYHSALLAAVKDPLTGVNNRSSMNSTLIRETELARRHEAPLSLIELDIDFFKNINDTHGHSAGDAVIIGVANVISNCIRGSDILFRSGGEEFVLILSNTDREGALLLAERIRSSIKENKVEHGKHKLNVTASLGVSTFEKGDDSESLFEKADTALYSAKSEGRNCVKFSETL